MELGKESASPPRISLWPLALLGIPLFFAALFTSKRTQSNHSIHANANTDNEQNNASSRSIAEAEQHSTLYPSGPTSKRQRNKPEWEEVAAKAQTAAALIAILLLVVSILQVRASREAISATRDAVAESTKQHRITVRPWVGPIQDVTALKATPVEFNAQGDASIGYSLVVKNFGSIPAQGVQPDVQLVVTNHLERVIEAENVSCDGNRKSDARIGVVLFPQGVVIGQSVSFYPRFKMVIPDKNSDGKVSVHMVTCTTYRDQFGCSFGTKATYRLDDSKTGFGISFPPPVNQVVKGGEFVFKNGSLDGPYCPEPQTKK